MTDLDMLSWLFAELKWAVGVRESMSLRQKIRAHFIRSVPARNVTARV